VANRVWNGRRRRLELELFCSRYRGRATASCCRQLTSHRRNRLHASSICVCAVYTAERRST